jgi:predicted signal transduction protein with EAL and GGDEF domain
MAREPDVDSDTLMKQADLALYRTKSEGRNGYRCRCAAAARSRSSEAISNGQIEIHYQSILHAKTRKLFGLEALARRRHPVKGFVPPSEFIPLAEESASSFRSAKRSSARPARRRSAGRPP